MPIGSQLKKTAILLLITTLTISLGTSLQWENPANGYHIPEDYTLNASSDNSGLTVEFWYNTDDQWESAGSTGESDGYYTIQGIDGNLGSYDSIELKANASGENTDTIDVTLDKGGPDVGLIEDENSYVQNDPELTFEVSDGYSEVVDVTASISSGDAEIDGDDSTDPECDAGDTCEVDFDVDTDGMDEGDDFEIEVEATDEVDNTGDTDSSITLDTSWDGDDSADVEWEESGSNVLSGFANEDQDVLVSLEPDSVSDTTISCEVDGDEVSTDSVDASDEEEELDCGFDHEDYASSSFDLKVEAEDATGNSETIVDGKKMIWDTEAPSVTRLSQSQGISTFNTGFKLDLEASDDASGIQTLEYYFDANTDVGGGNQISLDNLGSKTVDREINVDPNGLGQGNHTVYFRAEDGTGQTDVESFDFEYFPDRDPEVNFNAPETVEVTSGEMKTFSLAIENGAPFYLNGVEVQSDSVIWNGTVTAKGLKGNEEVDKTVTVDASNVDVGTYDLVLETVDMDDSVTIEVVVRATEDQKSQIESDLQEWSNLSSDLKGNVSSISTLDESNENVSSFLTKISKVQTAVDEGRYYEAKNILDTVDSDFENAQNAYSKALDEHQKNRRMLVLAFLGVFFLGGGGALGYFLYRNEGLELQEIEMPTELPGMAVVDRVMDALREVEEEEEYAFEGFS